MQKPSYLFFKAKYLFIKGEAKEALEMFKEYE